MRSDCNAIRIDRSIRFMPDLRKDPIVGRWVIIAKSRAKRPHDFDSTPQLAPAAGSVRSAKATKTTRRARSWPIASRHAPPNRPGWRVRVVPNKFPALEIEGDLNKRGEGIYDMMRGVGAHEVIIESPEHLRQHHRTGRREPARGAVGLPRPAGRSEEGPRGWSTA